MDMGEMMRMAFCVDSEGAPFAILRSADGDAPDVDSYAGLFHWNELYADDAERAASFYKDIFGYEVQEMNMGDGSYYMLNAGGKPRGGIMSKPMAEIPSMWLPYVHVEDIDATAAMAVAGGSKQVSEILDMPGIGRFTTLTDPAGAAFALITPATDTPD
jgi:hypothetical protein